MARQFRTGCGSTTARRLVDFAAGEVAVGQDPEHGEIELRRQGVLGPLDHGVHVPFGTGATDREAVVLHHRLLQRDVAFRDLGLVIIDEEQRFGVRHKESFKRMETTVDVLTMTATPIPRTLTWRSRASAIFPSSTPRRGTASPSTRTSSFDDASIRDGVMRELDRGGQVFFVHNRVQTIAVMAGLPARARPGGADFPRPRADARERARAAHDRFPRARVRRARLHDDHRERGSISRTSTRSSSTAPTVSGSPSSTSSAGASAARRARPTPISSSRREHADADGEKRLQAISEFTTSARGSASRCATSRSAAPATSSGWSSTARSNPRRRQTAKSRASQTFWICGSAQKGERGRDPIRASR